jgi:formamidopyrimidine-DNA glycosylase
MPELPEVETVRRGLSSLMVGRTVSNVIVHGGMLRFAIPRDLDERLRGTTLERIDRRAKYLLLRFSSCTLLSHLGMTGTWQARVEGSKKHDHIELRLDEGTRLVYNDPRRFGFVDWVEDDATHPRLVNLGPEPLDANAFHAGYLEEALALRKAPIKAALMDQSVVVGIGNIYAAEALFRAGIHPLAKASRVRIARLQALVSHVREILSAAIEKGGSTIDDFRRINGDSGYFQNSFSVYGREGLPCPRCAKALLLKVIAGRSSVYCSRCQRV